MIYLCHGNDATQESFQMNVQNTTGYKIDHTKGQNVGTVNQQWANRPDDQKFTSLGALRHQVALWADQSYVQNVTPQDLQVGVTSDMSDIRLIADGKAIEATNHSFHQLAQIAKAPASYLRTLPAPLLATNLNYGLQAAEQREQAFYLRSSDAGTDLRGITSSKYGRIYDRDVVDAVMQIAGNGVGDTRWKVPGTIDWSGKHGVTYNPKVDITKENTTLYASDRDLFLFLVDDMNPIEVGKLPSGDPDLMFRGFYVWNSEVGQRTFGLATMYLRGVCQNRNLWGVEGFSETTFRHTAGAPERFLDEAAPALASFAETNTSKLVEGVKAAKGAKVAVTDEERCAYLGKFGFSPKAAAALIETGIAEEGTAPETVWDHAQAITAHARTMRLQDERLAMEQVAGKMLNMVTA
jgi:hypothetical protein